MPSQIVDAGGSHVTILGRKPARRFRAVEATGTGALVVFIGEVAVEVFAVAGGGGGAGADWAGEGAGMGFAVAAVVGVGGR